MKNEFALPALPHTRNIICCFWQVNRMNPIPLYETIIPKGIIEIIFNFEGTDLYVQMHNQSFRIPRCFAYGFHTCPVQLHLADKQTFFGVVLYPTAAKYILHTPPFEFNNAVIDLTLIDTSFLALWQRLGEQKSFNERITIFTEWLCKRLPQLTEREIALNSFLNTHTNLEFSVADTAREFCYSSKQLSRKLNELTGLNTEQTLLYKKYLKAVHLMHSSQLSLTQIAYDCHFTDQSHFIKTFKSLSLLTPKEYRRRKSNIIGHIIENVF